MSSELKQWLLEVLLLVLAVIALASAPASGALLVSESTVGGVGYGNTFYSQITAELNVATGNDVTVVTDFVNAAQIAAADALWLDIRGLADTLGAAEITNLTAFIASGKRVVMIGDHVDWTVWDNSILAAVGGVRAGEADGVVSATATHELTAGVASVQVQVGSTSTAPAGATPLFASNVATLWGPSQNVLTVLDLNLFDNFSRAVADTAQFGDNVAAWIAAPVPEPTGGLPLLTLAGCTTLSRRARR